MSASDGAFIKRRDARKPVRSYTEIDLAGKTVLMQMSLDVPLNEGKVQDDERLRASIPTIEALLERGCAIVLVGHVGRPKGTDPALSTKPIAARLSQLLGKPVKHIAAVVGAEAEKEVQGLGKPAVAMLENVRYDPREQEADPGFARELARLAQAYVNDDYPDAHRASALNTVLPTLLPSGAGESLRKEHDAVKHALENPKRPFILIVGGAKADKIGAINHLLADADNIIVGGVLANTFLKASGADVRASKVDERSLEIAGEFLRDAEEKFLLPVDVVAASAFSEHADHREVPLKEIPPQWVIMDVGSQTLARYTEAIEHAGTVVWGGPVGVFEWAPYRRGTQEIAEALARSKAYTLVGGGDSGAAVHMLGLADKMSHVSIGGGATLTLIGGEELPAVSALR